jgi:hypothetical protein
MGALMGDDDQAVQHREAAVPHPRPAADEAADHTSAPPGTRREWVRALGQISGLLLALREAETDGATPPDPLAGGLALRAWSALTRPVLRDPDRITITDARPEVLALVARTARVLATSLCRWRVSGVADLVTTVLREEAAVHQREPEWLVAQVARVHGVLSAPDAVSAGVVWHALDDDPEETPWTT